MNKLEIPCSYQGGKQRLAQQIINIIQQENDMNDTYFYELCCGSGAVSLELLNRGFNPNNIIMIDNGGFGYFWKAVSENKFDLNIFKDEINKLPNIENIQSYLKDLSNKPVDYSKIVYHYLLLQAGSFGSKQIWIKDDKWKNNTFRNYWLPTETSNRKSPVNPMMPMPDTLFKRVSEIIYNLSGKINAKKEDVFNIINNLDCIECRQNLIIYIDPPYINTTGYGEKFDIYELLDKIPDDITVYVSEGYEMKNAKQTYLLSSGRTKGNISGEVKKKAVEEWLNKF